MLGINGSASEVWTLAKVFEVAKLIYFEFQLRDTHELLVQVFHTAGDCNEGSDSIL